MRNPLDIIEQRCINTSPLEDGYIVTGMLDKGSTRIDFLMKNGSGTDERMLRVTYVNPNGRPASDDRYALAENISPSLTNRIYCSVRKEINGDEYCFTEFDKSVTAENRQISGIINMGIDICTQLSDLDDRGYIHRNVKPANISFRGGAYYLNSFDGMELIKLCGPENYYGTCNYMAPETLNDAEFNSSTDVYALGITMYTMLTDGKLPFEMITDTIEDAIEIRARGEDIPGVPGVEPRLMDIILKACAADPADRYRRPSEFLADLKNYDNARSRDNRSEDAEYAINELKRNSKLTSRWNIEKCIGAGSYGVVFRVTDRENEEDPDRPFALKVISIPSFSTLRNNGGIVANNMNTRDFIDKMSAFTSRELSVWSQLGDCRNVVKLLEFGKIKRDDDAGCYYWMLSELLSPIDDIISDENTVARIGYDISAALADAHKKHNIWHRDVKPGNILYSDKKGYMLSDFGASNVLVSGVPATAIGSKPFMAPEILKHARNDDKKADYDFKIDIYSLGITMYILLNEGLGPFMKDGTYEEFKNDINRRCEPGVIFPPAKHASDNMMRIIHNACAYDPDDRYSSAEDMREAIENIMF